MKTPLFLIFALLLPAGAATPKVEDLSGQFPDAATRNQGQTGSCHVFSTISLIEAALYRGYGLRLALSEADLFVRKVVTDPDYYEKARLAVGAEDGTDKAYKFVEGGSPYEDINFVFETGVAKAKTAPWSAFTLRYKTYVAEQKKLIEKKRQGVVASAQFYEEGQKQVQSDYAAVGHLEETGMADRTAQIQRNHIQKVDMKLSQMRIASVANFHAYLSLIAGLSAINAEKLLLGDDPQLAKDRAAVKTMLVPMRVKKLSFPGYKPDADCPKAGALQKAALEVVLDKKIPLSISMELAGLSEWNQEKKKTAMHAFTIIGYAKDAAGTLTLKSRNSWGGDNPDVPEKHFCRIKRVVAVLTAKE